MIGEAKSAIVLGGGAVGIKFHVPRLIRIGGFTDICVVEPNQKRVEELKNQFASNQIISITESLPKGKPFSLAVIATPPKFHLYYVQELIGQCEDILIEKPIARTVDEAIKIVHLLDQNGVRGYICHIRRTLKSFSFVRTILCDGLFGDLLSVSVREGSVFNWDAASIGSFSRDLNGGGVLMDTGPHTLDLLFQVFDSVDLKKAWMDADYQNSEKAIEANCILELETNNGVPINVLLSRNRYLPNMASFQFEKAKVHVNVTNNTLSIEANGGTKLHCIPGDKITSPMDFNDLFDKFYINFIDKKMNEGVSPEDGLRVIRIIDKAYECSTLMTGAF